MLKRRLKSGVRALLAELCRDRPVLRIMAGPARGMRVPKEVGLANLAVLFGLYERAVTKAIASVERPVHVVYDVGAHLGMTTLTLAGSIGRGATIFAFEPLPDNVARLEMLRSANSRINLTIVSAALAEKTGTAQFKKSQAAAMGILADIAADDGAMAVRAENDLVQTLTLDAFVFDDAQPAPDFIKIDVEGAEGLVVAGGLRTLERHHPILLIELHGPKHAGEVWDLLRKQRYTWRYIDRRRGPAETIADRSQLLGYFGRDERWTQHVLLT